MSLEIKRLMSLEDANFLHDFATLPHKVRSEEYKVGIAGEEQAKNLIKWGYHHGSAFWMVKDGDKNILRISARKCPHIEKTATIGFFDVDLKSPLAKEAFQLAYREVEKHLQDQGIQKIVAPIDLNTWFNYRFSLPGKKFFPRFKWEPTTPPEYHELFQSQGYSNYVYFDSVFFPHFRVGNFCLGTGPLKRSYHRLFKQGFKLRPFDREHFMEKELPVFYEISHEAFQDAHMFEAIDLQTFSQLYAVAIKSYDFSPSSVLIAPDGETAGFIFAFYDGDWLIIKSIAIKKKYQGLGISSGMIYNAALQSFKLSKVGTVSAMVRSGIASEGINSNVKKTLWFTRSHDYVLLKKDLK